MAAGGMGRRRGPTLAERSAAARAGGDHGADDRRAPGPAVAGHAVTAKTSQSGAAPGHPAADDAGPPGAGPYTPNGDAARRGPRRRHCWVAGPGDGSGPWPGLVVEWQRDDRGWRARVVYLVGEPDTATTVETWVDAAHLRPA